MDECNNEKIPRKGYKTVKGLFGKEIEIPEEWEILEFRDIAKVRRGASPRPIENPKYFGYGRGWVRISDVSKSNKYLVKTRDYLSDLGESKSVAVNEGDVIMSIAATVGRPIVVKMKACIHDGFITFSNLSYKMNNEFLYYLLIKIESAFTSIGQHGTQSNINSELVSKTKFLNPPLPEQQKIASILSRVDALIESIQNVIEKATRLKKGLMQQLLTKGIGHDKFKKVLVIPRFINFIIPVSWKTCQLHKISIEIKDGPMGFGLHTYDYVEKGIPVLRIQNLQQLTITKNALRFISEEKHEELKKSQVKSLDIVISKTGVLGRIGIMPIDYGSANLNQALARITLKDKKILPFVALFLSSKISQQILNVIGSGRTVQAGLKLSDIKNLEIPIPPLQEQTKIASILSGIDAYIQKNMQYKEKLERLKKGLMQNLLTGQIRVKV